MTTPNENCSVDCGNEKKELLERRRAFSKCNLAIIRSSEYLEKADHFIDTHHPRELTLEDIQRLINVVEPLQKLAQSMDEVIQVLEAKYEPICAQGPKSSIK